MNFIDRIICELDTGLRTVFAQAHAERRMPKPETAGEAEAIELDIPANLESARLMRVNHCGEVCAQALYQGQAMVAKDPKVQKFLLSAASEEHDHLAWCGARIAQLGGRTSRLAPFFYAGAFGMGAVSGLLGDKWSMGFLVETERQVEAHLHDHLGRISPNDRDSRAILDEMRKDEIRHGEAGRDHGAAILPLPLRVAMRAFSKVMTKTTYWV
jgi:ubiquinone biosynthesis monooxygenase Coq7